MNNHQRMAVMWTLFAVAVVLHFTFISWDDYQAVLLFFRLKDQAPDQKLVGIGAGLVVPVILIGCGIFVGAGERKPKP
jgi:hypothetical protein